MMELHEDATEIFCSIFCFRYKAKLAQTFEMVLKQVFECYSPVMTCQQHVLVGSTIRSYLAWLKDQRKMDIVIEDNLLKFVTVA